MAELSASDIIAMRNNDGMFGGNGFMGIFGLLILLGIMNGGFGGWGGNNQQYATREQVQAGFDAMNSADSQRDILNAVTTAGTNGIAATKEAQYETISVMKDAQVALTRELGMVEAKGDGILAKLNECCCSILRGLDSVKYDALKNKDDLSERMNAMERRITDQLTEDKVSRLEREISDLKLGKALCGVVRYPTSATYDAGAWPFGGGAARVAASTGT